jgi:hypothetical protein
MVPTVRKKGHGQNGMVLKEHGQNNDYGAFVDKIAVMMQKGHGEKW